MKHERSLRDQTNRIDREKANKIKPVQRVPETGEETDLIYKGDPPPAEDTPCDGLYIRLQGRWACLIPSDIIRSEDLDTSIENMTKPVSYTHLTLPTICSV